MALNFVFRSCCREAVTSRRWMVVAQQPASMYLSNKSTKSTDLKQPMPAYIRFHMKERAATDLDDHMSTVEFGKIVGQKWRKLPQEEKDKYKQEASEERKLWLASLTAEEKQMMKEARITKRAEKLKKKESKDTKTKVKHLKEQYQMPGAPGGPYIAFLKTLDRGDGPVTAFVKAAAQRYKQLPKEDKEALTRKYANDKAKYEEDYKKWLKTMFRQGNANLLIKSQVLQHSPKPVRPRGAKYVYVDERLGKTETDNMTDGQLKVLKSSFEQEFAALSAVRQQTYVGMFQKLVKDYNKKLEDWYQAIQESGVTLFKKEAEEWRKEMRRRERKKLQKAPKKVRVRNAMKRTEE